VARKMQLYINRKERRRIESPLVRNVIRGLQRYVCSKALDPGDAPFETAFRIQDSGFRD
jgi:hypothetical protein